MKSPNPAIKIILDSTMIVRFSFTKRNQSIDNKITSCMFLAIGLSSEGMSDDVDGESSLADEDHTAKKCVH